MTIYIDIIFLENIVMNSIILLATGVILKDKTRILGNIISSTIGAFYSILVYVSNITIYSNVFMKIILSIVMIYIAFAPTTLKQVIKHLVIFYLTSFTFGGVTVSLLYFVKPQDILYRNGVLIGTYPIKIVIIGGIVGFIFITASFKNIKEKFSKKDIYCKLKILDTNIIAIIDSGNFLRDPISKTPVIVVEKECLREIFPVDILDNTVEIVNGKSINLGEYASKMRVIPFKSLGKENGLLLGIKMDNVRVEYQDMVIVKDAIIGIYSGVLSKNGKYNALIGMEILSQ